MKDKVEKSKQHNSVQLGNNNKIINSNIGNNIKNSQGKTLFQMLMGFFATIKTWLKG